MNAETAAGRSQAQVSMKSKSQLSLQQSSTRKVSYDKGLSGARSEAQLCENTEAVSDSNCVETKGSSSSSCRFIDDTNRNILEFVTSSAMLDFLFERDNCCNKSEEQLQKERAADSGLTSLPGRAVDVVVSAIDFLFGGEEESHKYQCDAPDRNPGGVNCSTVGTDCNPCDSLSTAKSCVEIQADRQAESSKSRPNFQTYRVVHDSSNDPPVPVKNSKHKAQEQDCVDPKCYSDCIERLNKISELCKTLPNLQDCMLKNAVSRPNFEGSLSTREFCEEADEINCFSSQSQSNFSKTPSNLQDCMPNSKTSSRPNFEGSLSTREFCDEVDEINGFPPQSQSNFSKTPSNLQDCVPESNTSSRPNFEGSLSTREFCEEADSRNSFPPQSNPQSQSNFGKTLPNPQMPKSNASSRPNFEGSLSTREFSNAADSKSSFPTQSNPQSQSNFERDSQTVPPSQTVLVNAPGAVPGVKSIGSSDKATAPPNFENGSQTVPPSRTVLANASTHADVKSIGSSDKATGSVDLEHDSQTVPPSKTVLASTPADNRVKNIASSDKATAPRPPDFEHDSQPVPASQTVLANAPTDAKLGSGGSSDKKANAPLDAGAGGGRSSDKAYAPRPLDFEHDSQTVPPSQTVLANAPEDAGLGGKGSSGKPIAPTDPGVGGNFGKENAPPDDVELDSKPASPSKTLWANQPNDAGVGGGGSKSPAPADLLFQEVVINYMEEEIPYKEYWASKLKDSNSKSQADLKCVFTEIKNKKGEKTDAILEINGEVIEFPKEINSEAFLQKELAKMFQSGTTLKEGLENLGKISEREGATQSTKGNRKKPRSREITTIKIKEEIITKSNATPKTVRNLECTLSDAEEVDGQPSIKSLEINGKVMDSKSHPVILPYSKQLEEMEAMLETIADDFNDVITPTNDEEKKIKKFYFRGR